MRESLLQEGCQQIKEKENVLFPFKDKAKVLRLQFFFLSVIYITYQHTHTKKKKVNLPMLLEILHTCFMETVSNPKIHSYSSF